MRPDSRSDVPTEKERGQEVPIGTELHQVALRPVIASVSPKQDAPVRRDGRRGRLIIKNPSRRWFVDGGIDTRVCTYPAATWCTVEWQQCRAGICPIIATIVETTTE